MELEILTNQMADHAVTIQSLTVNVPEDQARWKPEAETWSILEVINHLYDEEREDFRVRVDYLLHHPGESWPPINPKGWVMERAYNERDLKKSVEAFLEERRKSLEWLRGLEAPDWQTSVSGSFGQFFAGDILSAWAAHDLLHLRQLIELHWAYLPRLVQPYQVSYAGEW